jgi:hypothetical protein
MTEEISPEKSTSIMTEEKATATVHSEKLPPPAVASPPSRQRLHLLPMKWEALLILQLAITKATTTRLHFWLSMAATAFIVATLMAIASERLRARETPLWRAVLNAWCGRYRREIDNFWNILLSRVGLVFVIREILQAICLLVLLLLMGYDWWWLGGAGNHVSRYFWAISGYEVGFTC